MPHQHGLDEGRRPNGRISISRFVLLGFIGIAGALLLWEHRVHALGALPWLILPACLFLHLFMHGGHGKHGGTADRQGDGQ